MITIHNGIDLNMFYPRKSDYRVQNHLGDKKVYLAVASVWTKEKGFDDLEELSNQLNEDEILLVTGSLHFASNFKKIYNLINNK